MTRKVSETKFVVSKQYNTIFSCEVIPSRHTWERGDNWHDIFGKTIVPKMLWRKSYLVVDTLQEAVAYVERELLLEFRRTERELKEKKERYERICKFREDTK